MSRALENTREETQRGTFVIFEGGEGSGKDTHIAKLKELYSDRNDIVFTREPGGTRIGEKIREILLSKESAEMSVEAELLLFLAARAHLIHEVIDPALRAGKTVISNRFGLSTIAYQIYGRERHAYKEFLDHVNTFVVGTYMPDYCIFLDVSPEVGLARTRTRNEKTTRFDEEELAFHYRVQEGYKKHLQNFGKTYRINADAPFDEVWENVQNAMASIIV